MTYLPAAAPLVRIFDLSYWATCTRAQTAHRRDLLLLIETADVLGHH